MAGHPPSAELFVGLKKGLNDVRADILSLPHTTERLLLVEGVALALNIFSQPNPQKKQRNVSSTPSGDERNKSVKVFETQRHSHLSQSPKVNLGKEVHSRDFRSQNTTTHPLAPTPGSSQEITRLWAKEDLRAVAQKRINEDVKLVP